MQLLLIPGESLPAGHPERWGRPGGLSAGLAGLAWLLELPSPFSSHLHPQPHSKPTGWGARHGHGDMAQEHASPSTSAALTASSYLEQVALAGVRDFLLPFPVQPGKTTKR